MRLSDAAGLTLRRIRGRLLESMMVVVGVALGVGAIGVTLALSRMVRQDLPRGAHVREISVRSGEMAENRSAAVVPELNQKNDRPAPLSVDDIAAVKAVSPDVLWGFMGMPIQEDKSSDASTPAAVVAGEYFQAFGLEAAEGSLISAEDQATGARVAVLGAERARREFPGGSPIGGTIRIFGVDYRVVGVLRPAPVDPSKNIGEGFPQDLLAFIPLRGSVIFDKMKAPPMLSFMARDDASVRQAVQEVRAYYEQEVGGGQVSVTSFLEEADAQNARNDGILAVLLTFAAAALLVASVNILNVLLARAARRVKDTGISVALGSARRGIFGQYLLESVLLGVMGSALGIAVVYGLASLLNVLFSDGGDSQHLTVPAVSLLAAAAVALGLNVILGLWPAMRASRLNPADALRAE